MSTTEMATASIESCLIWVALLTAIRGPPTADTLTEGQSLAVRAIASSSIAESSALCAVSLVPYGDVRNARP